MKTIAGKNSKDSHVSAEAAPAAVKDLARVPNDRPSPAAAPPLHSDAPAAPQPSVGAAPAHRYRMWLLPAGAVAALAAGAYFLAPWVRTALDTVSTEEGAFTPW